MKHDTLFRIAFGIHPYKIIRADGARSEACYLDWYHPFAWALLLFVILPIQHWTGGWELIADRGNPFRPVPWHRRPRIRYDKIRRNDPCPCGSGKKSKRCCNHAFRKTPVYGGAA